VRIEPADIRKKGKVPKNGSLFFTIFQTFMSGPEKDGSLRPISASIRRISSTSSSSTSATAAAPTTRATGAAFSITFAPAVQLGLTATPRRRDNVDTYAYFGEPVYSYSLKDGINDGFLTPFRVKQIATTLDDYVFTPDDTLVEARSRPASVTRKPTSTASSRSGRREQKRVEIFIAQIDPREKTLCSARIRRTRWWCATSSTR